MRDHYELSSRRPLADDIGEPSDVRFIQRRVHLIENAEGRRVNLEQGEDQRNACECSLPTREVPKRLQTLARRLSHDIDPTCNWFVRIAPYETGFTTFEEPLERTLKGVVHLGQRGIEPALNEQLEIRHRGL